MASEDSGSAVELPPVPLVAVTVKVAVPVTRLPSGFGAMAVITVVPAPAAVREPLLVMEATEVLLEVQATVLVRSRVPGVEEVDEKVPIAISCMFCPTTAVCEFGVIAIDCKGSVDEPVTVKDAFAVTAVPSGLVQMAVTAVVPEPIAVARPVVAPIVATAELVTLQVTWLVRFFDRPVLVVPIAINWPVWPTVATVSVLGAIVSAVTGSEVPVPALTVTSTLEEIKPLKPWALAVIVV